MSKALLKSALFAVAPRWTATRMAARARAHSHAVVRHHQLHTLTAALVDHLGRHVLEGPCQGTVLTPMCDAEHLGPFLLGVYESELDRAWDSIFKRSYGQVLDVGAKFGYYAVGLARRYPKSTVVAFDIDPWSQRALREMVAANGVGNLEIAGFCDGRWLNARLQPSALIVSDCEGFEVELFEGATTTALRSATLLIETHDSFVPDATTRVRARFQATHEVEVFTQASPRRSSNADLSFLSPSERHSAEHEMRGEQTWLLCTPHMA